MLSNSKNLLQSEVLEDGAIVTIQSKIRCMCINNSYFTNGDNGQYTSLFMLIGNRESVSRIATVIWICSITDKSIDDIEKELEEIIQEEIKKRSKEAK